MTRENDKIYMTYKELLEVSKRDEISFNFIKRFRKLSEDSSDAEIRKFCEKVQNDIYVKTEFDEVNDRIAYLERDIEILKLHKAEIGEAHIGDAIRGNFVDGDYEYYNKKIAEDKEEMHKLYERRNLLLMTKQF